MVIDDLTLPDIPEEYMKIYPYLVILRITEISSNGSNKIFMAFLSSVECFHMLLGNLTALCAMPVTTKFVILALDLKNNVLDTQWRVLLNAPFETQGGFSWDFETVDDGLTELVYANYHIKLLTTTGAGTSIDDLKLTDKIYFKSPLHDYSYLITHDSITELSNEVRKITEKNILYSPKECLEKLSKEIYFHNPNGTEWKVSNRYEDPNQCLHYSNGKWISINEYVSSTGAYGLDTSSDGRGWGRESNEAPKIKHIEYYNGIWIGAAQSNSGFYYSTDGINWTQTNITTGNYNKSKYANGMWVIISDAGQGIHYSTDGITWTATNLATARITDVDYADGIWVAGASDGNLYYSLDGISWSINDGSLIIGAAWLYVKYGDGIWVASGHNKGLWYSSDGKTWTQSNLTSTIGSLQIHYANGKWVAAGGGKVYNSTDGMNWTEIYVLSTTASNSDGNYAIANGNGIWLLNNYTHGLWYSIDGTNWTKTNLTNMGGTEIIHDDDGNWAIADPNGKGIWNSKTWDYNYL